MHRCQSRARRRNRYPSTASFVSFTAAVALAAIAALPIRPARAATVVGPIANAGTQPQGALTGVTVFCSGGHGWTAGESEWFLQRPLVLDMVEDYGNLDQLNYFVEYAYNAGATVVPFRPVGYQTTELVYDNDDPEVTYTGAWVDTSETTEYYENGRTLSGVPFRQVAASPIETAVARYTATPPKTDSFPVYAWTRDDDNRVRQTYRVTHAGGVATVVVDHRMVGKGWVWLGNYYFRLGGPAYVEISNASPDAGLVIADAIRFGNGWGDVERPGPGTISGFPREEECSRYWAESEAGVRAVGLPSTIWDTGADDQGDNTGTAARWSSLMNRQSFNNDRWRRIYIEFHTNAAGCPEGPPCGARGMVTLVNSTTPTSNQTAYASTLSNKFLNDMLDLDDGFEYLWVPRSSPISGSYGAISTTNNNDEFDATILEVAFHDNPQDVALLLDPNVRNATARSALQGMITFLAGLPGSTVPLVFLPDPPQDVRAVQNGDGHVTLSWSPPPTGGAHGHAATGYRLYRSSDGHGFDAGVALGDVASVMLNDVPADTTTYFRVAAANAGGESLPSETVAVRVHPPSGARVLIVNGFDRIGRTQTPTQSIPLGSMRRPIAARANSFDYVIQHADAIAAAGYAFDSTSNEPVESGALSLTPYDAVVWILGVEAAPNETFSAAEQAVVTAYLQGGGRLFVTGAEIGANLYTGGVGATFFTDVLGATMISDSAGTSGLEGAAGGILAGLANFSFGVQGTAPYRVDSPDAIGPRPGATTIINYRGRTLVSAGILYDTGTYKAVTFGFPFESIHSDAMRFEIMRRVLDALIGTPADFDRDGDVDLSDFAQFLACFNGPAAPPASAGCDATDLDHDGDVDLADFGVFLACFNGPARPPACE